MGPNPSGSQQPPASSALHLPPTSHTWSGHDMHHPPRPPSSDPLPRPPVQRESSQPSPCPARCGAGVAPSFLPSSWLHDPALVGAAAAPCCRCLG